MDFAFAITEHVKWKVKFREAIALRQKVDLDAIGRNDQCELGRWLQSHGREHYGANPKFAALVAAHDDFHRYAGDIATEINGGNYPRASALIGEWGEYGGQSTAVINALSELEQAIAGLG
mgnify:CR=1 FL=1